jgi:ADP-ribose pyrophosphatase YjhB (NUDIX family)
MHVHSGPERGAEAFSFCPKCGARLESRVLKASEPERLVCTACAFVFFLDPKVATGCIVEVDGGIALLRRSIEPGYGKWVFPGGYVDRGEPVEAAAVRETLEEACLGVRLTSLLGVYSYPDRPIVVVVYTGEVTSGRFGAADEALEARVFRPDRVPWSELAFSSTFDALRDYVRRFHALEAPPDARPEVL